MAVTVTFQCDECHCIAKGTDFIRRVFRGVTGKPYGFGHYEVDSVENVAPKDWVVFDTIGRTYCPKCWESISESR